MKYVLLFVAVLAYVNASAIKRSPKAITCVELNADTTNEDLQTNLGAVLDDILANAAVAQPDYGIGVLDPYLLEQSATYSLPGPLGTTVDISLNQVNIVGLGAGQVNSLVVSGSGTTRQVALALAVAQMTFTSGNYVATSPVNINGTFTGSSSGNEIDGTGDLSAGSLANVVNSGSIDSISLESDPPSPLTEDSQKQLIINAAGDEITKLLQTTVSIIVQESCA